MELKTLFFCLFTNWFQRFIVILDDLNLNYDVNWKEGKIKLSKCSNWFSCQFCQFYQFDQQKNECHIVGWHETNESQVIHWIEWIESKYKNNDVFALTMSFIFYLYNQLKHNWKLVY